MAKTYTRKQLGSLDQLDLEQQRIKYKAKRIEDDWMDTLLNPQQLAIGLITKLLKRKSTASASYLRSDSKKGVIAGKKSAVVGGNNVVGFLSGLVKKPVVKKIAKSVGVSFVQWQLFNLAVFIGKKAYRAFKEKKSKKEWRAKPL